MNKKTLKATSTCLAIFLFFINAIALANHTSKSGQDPILDSLLQTLKSAKDTTEINTINALSRFYSNSNYDQSLNYAEKALKKAEKLNYKKGIANGNINIGVVNWNKGQYDEAKKRFNVGLKLNKEIGNIKGVSICYNNIGLVHWTQGYYDLALEFILKSLKISEQLKDTTGIAMSYTNIGNIYQANNKTEKALEYYLKSLKINEKLNNKVFLGICYNNIGLIYSVLKSYDTSITYHLKALKINEEIGNTKAVGMSYGNIGLIYLDKQDYYSALENFNKSFQTAKKIEDIQGQAVALNNIGSVNIELKKFDEALKYNTESLEMCKKIGYTLGCRDVYSTLVRLFEAKNDYKTALQYYKLYTDLKDSLINEESSKQITDMNAKYGSEKKDQEIQLLNIEKEKQASIVASEKRKQLIILISVLSVLLLVAVFALFIYRSFVQKKRLNAELEKLSIVASETDNGVLICGPNGEIEWCNAGLTRLLGYTFEELKQKGKTLAELSSNPDIKQLIETSLKNKKSSSYQVLNVTKSGEKRWTQSTLTPIVNSNGEIKKLVVIDTDINERKSIEEKLGEQNQELEQSHQSLSILGEIGQEITSELSIEKIVEKTYGNVNKLMDADVFCIGIHNKINNSIDFPGFIEKGRKFNSSYNLNDNNRLPVVCFKKQQEIFINDLEKDFKNYISDLPAPVAGEQPESLIYLPLVINEKIVGVINVESFNKNAYTPYHLNILKNLAIYVAIAIENAKLYNNLEKMVEERTKEVIIQKEEIEFAYNNIKVLSEIGQEITSTLNFEKVLDTVYEKVNSLMDAVEFGIGIYDAEKKAIDFSNYYYESKHMGGDLDVWVSLEEKNRLSVWCIENKKAVFINDMQQEYKLYIQNLDSYIGEGKLLLESVICLPLIIEEKLVGLISVQSSKKNAYTRKHLEVLQTLGSYIAIALDNARLYNNMEGEVKARTKEIEQQKVLVEDKNLKITDSINYALRIQQAILPSQKMINSILPDSFVFFKPKDIVSGDFYWAHAIDEHRILFAAVDCTGHGVPGAFMSIMGYNLLEQIVKDQKIYEPAAILNELSKLVVHSLKQTDAIGSLKEGMDIALCTIDYRTFELEYAGAHNPLIIIKQGIMSETKANRRSIGIALANSTPFVNHKVQLSKGDCLYIFSDGYADQRGGPLNQKYYSQPFRQLLTEVSSLNMSDQESKLENIINDWKNENEQIDDMLVIGVRV